MAWTTLTLQVTTPLFNGGADSGGTSGLRAGDDPGVRVASVRGAMRFWFRALAGTLVGPDTPLLADLERRVFGGIADRSGGEEAATASPLILRIPDPPSLSREKRPAFLQGSGDARWIGYLLGLGLMRPVKGGAELLRPFVPPQTSFDLKLSFRHDRRTTAEAQQAAEALAYASLWLACAYGGLGARVRKGFGGLRIVDVAGEVSPPWTPRGLLTPGLEFYRSAEWMWPWSAKVFGIFEQHLRELVKAAGLEAGTVEERAEPPSYPVLSRRHSPAVLVSRSFRTWDEVLGYGGRQLRLFRANRPDGQSPSDRERRRQARVRTAEWDDAIHGDSADFPLGALGLPVGYHDKRSDYTFMVNAVDTESGDELRRASPLWLRPVPAGDSWRLFTFAFQTRFLPGPDAARVRLLPGEEARRDGWQEDELFVDQADVSRLVTQWMATMRSGGDFTSVIRN